MARGWGNGRGINRDNWPESGPHRRLLEHYDEIHAAHGWPSLSKIIEHGRTKDLGISARDRVSVILTGKRPPTDERQAERLARALGGGDDDGARAAELFRAMLAERRSADERGPVPQAPVDDELDGIADRLASAMSVQWGRAAGTRLLRDPAPLELKWRRNETVVGPPSEATTARTDGSSFAPLPGLTRITPAQLRQGDRASLFKVYGGLASGRLVITGGPGTGKSSAAVLLLLDALHHRETATAEQRRRIPVPVLFTLRDWDPDTTSVTDWVGAKLTEIALLRGGRGRRFAKRLVEHGRVAVFLDGLDELPEAAHAAALQALSEQATFRLVLLSRTTAFADAAQHHTLTRAAAVEPQPLAPAEAARYLLRPFAPPPAPWRELAAALTKQPGSPIAQAMTSPLRVTLLRDIYSPAAAHDGIGPVNELLDTKRFPDVAAIERHLLEHTVPAAYTPRPGRPSAPYTVDTAGRTLARIARNLNAQDKNRDFAWWTLAAWLPAWQRTLFSVLGGMILSGPVFGLASLLLGGFRIWPEVALWYAITLGLPTSLAVTLAFNLTTGASSPPRALRVIAAVAGGLAVSLAAGLYTGGWSLSVSTFGYAFAVSFGITARTRGGATLKSLSVGRGLWSARRIVSALLLALALGVANSLFGAVAFTLHGAGTLVTGLVHGLNGVITSLLVIAPLIWLTGAFTDGPASANTVPTGPLRAWRGDFRLWATVGLAVGVASGVNSWLAYPSSVYGLSEGRANALVESLAAGLALGVVYGVLYGRAWLTTVTQVWFTLRYRTPLRLMRFLEDSHERNLLRTVGPIYQFRHATLQDHLAQIP
ncbi:hypothetical protein NLX83_32975 [Allokutzneria sp. A3M-2-11 16]|uniref:hypothetical protein n=1 Tax=Allokutzneria sp. A3M-2-11 16 TaxID=2962043 RepID=UPI0020B722DE|nr:hypothetical protein [Allokutzneria sp. A3M-2-11 16]MCP3804096.1 hypothetical protein [Allokutzneria sp. A3M-2-11 16]